MHYGLTHPHHAVDIVNAVCAVLGNGSNGCANLLMLETSQQETHLGEFEDPGDYTAGVGLCQADPIGFQDVQRRTRDHNLEAIKEAFGIDLLEVEHRELAYSPLLAFIVCRLHYKLRPERIPMDIHGRAEYWKKFYNSELGKGTVEEYVENAARLQETLR